jgi:hypothetical protein
MDLIINSTVQSPLFRNLAHIPSDRLAFSHHISSNAPPLSKTKITVEPETANNSLDSTYKFRIPQFGYLNKVTLKVEYDIYPVTRWQVTPLLPLYHIIDEISLRSHHRPIQTVFGREMLIKHAYFSDPDDASTRVLGQLNIPPGQGLVDLGALFQSTNGAPFNPVASSAAWTTQKRRITLFVEVPFASTYAPHVNFDTRFVEFLDVYVKLSTTNGGKPCGQSAALLELDLAQPFNADKSGKNYAFNAKTTTAPDATNMTTGSTNGVLLSNLAPATAAAASKVIANQNGRFGDGTEPAVVDCSTAATTKHSFCGIFLYDGARNGSAAAGNLGMPWWTVASDVFAMSSAAQASYPGCQIGSFGKPLTPCNWVRLGGADYASADFAGWGNKSASSDDNIYDTYDRQELAPTNNTASTFGAADADARTAAHWAADALATDKAFGRRADETDFEAAGAGTTDLANKAHYGSNSQPGATVGPMWKRAILERYYTVYPHMNTGNTTFTTTALGTGTAVGGTLADPVVLGGSISKLNGQSQGGINYATPMNIACTLSCLFLNYHDKIREDISLENYKDDQPATILQYDTAEEQVNVLYGTSSSSYATSSEAEMILPIKSNHLAYAISIIAFRDLDSAEVGSTSAHSNQICSRSTCIGASGPWGYDHSSANQPDIVIRNQRESTNGTLQAPKCAWPCYSVVENFKTVLPSYVALKGSGRPIYECGADTTSGTSGIGGAFSNVGQRRFVRGAGSLLAEGDMDNLGFQYNKGDARGALHNKLGRVDEVLQNADRAIVGNINDHTSKLNGKKQARRQNYLLFT